MNSTDSTGLPFYLSPQPYGDPNVDRSTVPAEALPGYDQYNSSVYGFNQGLQNGLVQAGPQFAMSQTARDNLASQIAQLFGSQSQQSQYLNQDYATGIARLGLQNDQLGVQRGNIGLDREALGLDRQGIGLQRNNLGFDLRSIGIQRDALGRQPQYLTALHELANQGFNQNAATQTRGVNSSSTARGSFGSAGQRNNLSDIQSTLAQQLGGEAQRFYESMAGVNDQNRQLDVSQDRVGNQSKGLDLESQRLDINSKRLDQQNAMLDIQAKSLGLDRQALQTELGRGLDRLGLTTFMSTADLLDKMNSSNIQDQMLAQQIFNQAIQSSDYYSQFYNPGATSPSPVPSTSTPTGGGSMVTRN